MIHLYLHMVCTRVLRDGIVRTSNTTIIITFYYMFYTRIYAKIKLLYGKVLYRTCQFLTNAF